MIIQTLASNTKKFEAAKISTLANKLNNGNKFGICSLLLAIGFSATLAVMAQDIQGDVVVKLPIDRIITNKEGKSISSSILAKYGEKIQIRIGENPKVYVFNLAQLSQQDQDFLNTLHDSEISDWERGLKQPLPKSSKIELISRITRDENGPRIKDSCRRHYKTYSVSAILTKGEDLDDKRVKIRLVKVRLGNNINKNHYAIAKINSHDVTLLPIQNIDFGQLEDWYYICRCCKEGSSSSNFDFVAQVWLDGKLICQSSIDQNSMDAKKVEEFGPP